MATITTTTPVAPAAVAAQLNFFNNTGLISQDISDVIIYYSPIILSFCILIICVFYQTSKGVFFFLFVTFFGIIRKLLTKALFTKSPTLVNKNCSTFNIFQSDKTDGFVVYFVTFVTGYILAPMFIKNNYNIPVILILGLYMLMVIFIHNRDNCSSINIIFSNVFYGVICVIISVIILISAGLSDSLFNEDLQSDATICSMPSKQSFKCSVYKNGEIISSTTQ
jgi:hypothetical protein